LTAGVPDSWGSSLSRDDTTKLLDGCRGPRVHRERPCAVGDAGGKFQPHSPNGSRTREWCASPSLKGKPEALQSTAPTWLSQVRNTFGTRQRWGPFPTLTPARPHLYTGQELVNLDGYLTLTPLS